MEISHFFSSLVDKCYTLMDNKKTRQLTLAGIVLIAASVPLYTNDRWLNVIWFALFYMLISLGLNIIVGYCGLCHIGFAAKFAIGAYTTGILMKTFGWSFWLTLPASVVTSMLAACIIGGPTLRLRSDYLAIVTLGFGEIVRITARNLKITGGASGISGIKRPFFFGMQIKDVAHWYYTFLILVILFVIVSYLIKNSRFGRALEYIREDQDAAQAMGVNTTLYKLFAIIIGSVMGGIAGSFYTVRMTAISPSSFQFILSANVLLAVVLGGMGKIPGVLVGAAFLAIFPEIFRNVTYIAHARMLFFGILLIFVMIKRPQGLWPERKR
ncbi:MAG: branched-chain amino acid ABC transporter permease [Treponema sp.]|jgi:branched-chain amino acid transport system permease protein|nr:branched-chain amino acid ABC transporter permease [Treponema sp.]